MLVMSLSTKSALLKTRLLLLRLVAKSRVEGIQLIVLSVSSAMEPISSARAGAIRRMLHQVARYALRLQQEYAQQLRLATSFLLVPEDGPVHYGV